MFNIVVSTVTADDIAPLDAGSSADSDDNLCDRYLKG